MRVLVKTRQFMRVRRAPMRFNLFQLFEIIIFFLFYIENIEKKV